MLVLKQCDWLNIFLKNGPFPASFSFFSSFQYTVDSKQMFNISLIFADDWIWTTDLWYQKRPLYQTNIVGSLVKLYARPDLLRATCIRRISQCGASHVSLKPWNKFFAAFRRIKTFQFLFLSKSCTWTLIEGGNNDRKLCLFDSNLSQ